MKENYIEPNKINQEIEGFLPIYNSEGFKIEKYTRDNIESKIPESSELKERHPDLFDFLSFEPNAKKYNLGFIHVDMDGAISQKLASEGKNVTQIGFHLIKLLKDNLSKIAEQLNDKNSTEISKLDFLINISRLGYAENYLNKAGFEIFNINNNEERARFHTTSHQLVTETEEKLINKSSSNSQINKEKKDKPSKIILISKEAILEKYLINH